MSSRRSGPASTASRRAIASPTAAVRSGRTAKRASCPRIGWSSCPTTFPIASAATLMLKGLTVQYLFRQTYPLKGGETILFHAAAGGVGLIACQWARALGVTMIGTVGSDDKAALAKQAGCRARDRVHARELRRAREGDDRRQGRAGRLRRRRQGHVSRFARLPRAARPVRVLRQRVGAGRRVQHRHAGAEGLALRDAGPTLFTYTAKRDDLLAMANELFELVRSGKIKAEARQKFPLAEAAMRIARWSRARRRARRC